MEKNLASVSTAQNEEMFTPKIYTKDYGRINFGKEYKIKLTALFALKCCSEELHHFWLAANVKRLGTLNDIIMFKKSKECDQGITYFMQLKHQNVAKNIIKDMFLSTKGDFSLQKYFKCYTKLKNTIDDKTKNADIIMHLRQVNKMVFILFTNKGVIEDSHFLRKAKKNVHLDPIQMEGSIFEFVHETFTEIDTEFLEKFFLFTNQPHINNMDNEIKTAIKNLLCPLKLSEVDLRDIALKFVYYIDDWSKGRLSGHYPLTKTHILKKLTELLLLPYMLELQIPEDEKHDGNENAGKSGETTKNDKRDDNEEKNIWYELTRDKDVTVIEEVDNVVERYVNDSTYNILDNGNILDSVIAINKELLRVVSNSKNISKTETYELLWKTRKLPLLLQVFDSQGVKYIQDILKAFPEVFRVIILNKTKNPLEKFQFSKPFINVTDLNKKHQEQIFKCFVILQGRELSIKDLNIDIGQFFGLLKVKDIVLILSGQFNIGSEFEPLPEFFVEMSLSRNSLDVIQNKSISAKEALEDFCQNKKVLLVSADPGMGKSVLLNYFAKKLPINLWGLKVNLAKHKDQYKNCNRQNCNLQESFKEFIHEALKEEKTSNSNIFDLVFKKYLNSKHVVFLLDGFDEIPVECQDGAKELIRFIKESGYYTCVSTRPVLKRDLESVLNTFAVDLNRFTIDMQIYFLTHYFANIGKIAPSDKKVISFVTKLLKATRKNLNDIDNAFTGIPLETMLLAEVFSKDFIKYLDDEIYKNQHFDLSSLYKHFLNEKIQIAAFKVQGVPKNVINQFKKCRSFYALQHVFRDEDLEELQFNEKLKMISKLFPDTMQIIQKDGIIVTDSESNVSFVHQTYAEYLAAEWLSENILTSYKTIVKKLIKKTFDPSFIVVRNMFDRLLAKNCPLHIAVINREVNTVKEMISSDKNALITTDEGGRTILHLISAWGLHHPHSTIRITENMLISDSMMTIFKLLPSNKLTHAEDNLLNYTPLDYAVLSRSLSIADRICTNIKTLNCCVNITKAEADNILRYVVKLYSTSLFAVILRSHIRTEYELLFQNEDETSDLHRAINKGNIENVRSLISKKNINKKDINGFAPIHIAVIRGHADITRLLLLEKANVNTTDNSGRSPLHWASYQGNLDIVLLLISNRVDLATTDCYDRTALDYSFLSSSFNQSEIASVLIESNSRVITTDFTTDYNTVLKKSLPTFSKINKITNFLVRKDSYNMNALHWATQMGKTGVINLILSKNIDVDTKGWRNMTALQFAVQNNDIDIVNILLSKGADITAKDDDDDTALHFAARNGYTRIVRFLLSRGAHIDAKNKTNRTPLHYAVTYGHKDISNLLLTKDTDPEATDKVNYTPLHVAVMKSHEDITNLAKDTDPEAKDKDYETVLYIAARKGHKDTFDMKKTLDPISTIPEEKKVEEEIVTPKLHSSASSFQNVVEEKHCKEINILLLGETGVGKSTFINAFANYLTYSNLSDAENGQLISLVPSKFTITDENFEERTIEIGHSENESQQEVAASSTQNAESYVFPFTKSRIRLIDTPGIGDARGTEQDNKNFAKVLDYVGELKELHAICILLKPNNARIRIMSEYCIKQLSSRLEKSAVQNIIFLFTNSRNTFYRPGDTLPQLRKIVEETENKPPYVKIPVGRQNIFCVDNETFHFLVGQRHKIKFNEREKEDFASSWKVSSEECFRLLAYVAQLEPYKVENTIFVNRTRRFIAQLDHTLVDIAGLIQSNIELLQRQKVELDTYDNDIQKLKGNLYVPIINVRVEKSAAPSLVCAALKCCEVYQINGIKTLHYKQVCQTPCCLVNVPKEIIGLPELLDCPVMNSNRHCNACGCIYLTHMQVDYETHTYEDHIVDENVNSLIATKENAKKVAEHNLKEIEKKLQEYEQEQNTINKSASIISSFLKHNTTTKYNAYQSYLEYLIEREKSIGSAADKKSIENYQNMLEQYIEEQKALDKAFADSKRENITSDITPQDVIKSIQQLYSLPHSGCKIKELFDIQKRAKGNENYTG